MLRDLLVRVSAGLLSAAIAVSCSHDEDKRAEQTSSVAQAVTLAGAGGAAAGAPDVGLGGVPDSGGAPGAGGAPPKICIEVTCKLGGDCLHCDVNNDCVPYQAGDNHECRADSKKGCDIAESCNGGAKCPDDAVVAQDVKCRDEVAGGCDTADFCDGKSDVCVDKKKAINTECRPLKANSLCDVAEVCDGQHDKCPDDDWKKSTVVCRPSAANTDGCDPAENCPGDSADCPADAKQANGFDCVNTSSNKCATAATCNGGVCQVNQLKQCALATDCKNAEVCNTGTGNCDPSNKPNTTTCDDKIDCTKGDHCQNGACASGTEDDDFCINAYKRDCAAVFCDATAPKAPGGCRLDPAAAVGKPCRQPAGTCDIAEKCDGVLPDCPAEDKRLAPGTSCLPASCGNNQAQPEAKCDGGAVCLPPAKVSCSGYACVNNACGTSCATSADCNQDYYCLNKVCEPRTGAGKTCDVDAQCSQSNPYCVDGVCCDAKCTGQCEACDVKDKPGVCSIVTGEPHGKRTACLGDGSLCNGTCGSKRAACDFPKPQTVCQEAACDPATGTAVEQAFCDGAGKCAMTDPMDCTPFTCSATACRGNCVTDAQCIAGAYCKAGICEDLEKPGTKCARDQQCASGFCTDGVCCEGRCNGQCEACGSGGKCEPVTGAPAGRRPACAGEDGDTCAGACDGTVRASCVYPATETVCADAACDAGKASVVAHCSGGGACAKAPTVTCPNGCEGAICAGDACVVSSDCKEKEHCIAGTCAPLADAGDACSAASDCGSGFCVDGVCCNRACDGQCEACDGAKAGDCAPISGAPHGGRVQCNSDGSACAGACDGKEPLGCSYPSGTVCADGSCTPGQDGNEAVATVEASCNGTGRCPAASEQACGGFGCDAKKKQCNGDCADGSACPSGKYCSAGVCVTSQPSGSACQAASECASGFCVDGYCCGSACDDRCAACDVPGSLGKCSPVSGATHGGRAACQGGGVCGSQCDGKSVTDCAFPDKDTSCSEPYCSSGTQVAASSCDGAGQCKPGEQTACASFACDGAECSDACKTDADCTGSLQCHESKCVEPYKINAVDEGTCGCRAPGGRPSAPGGFLALAAVTLLSLSRRRRAHGALRDS